MRLRQFGLFGKDKKMLTEKKLFEIASYIENMENPKFLNLTTDQIKGLKLMQEITSNDTARPVLGGIKIDASANTMVACDGFKLVIMQNILELESGLYAITKFSGKICKVWKFKDWKFKDNTVNYPEWEKILPDVKEKSESDKLSCMIVNPELLTGIVKHAGHSFRMIFNIPEQKHFAISSIEFDGTVKGTDIKFYGVIMPMAAPNNHLSVYSNTARPGYTIKAAA